MVKFLVAGSNMTTWRFAALIGNIFAEGWSDPALQTSGLAAGRILAAYQTRAFSSSIRLRGMVWACHIFSSPQYIEGAMIGLKPPTGSSDRGWAFLLLWRHF